MIQVFNPKKCYFISLVNEINNYKILKLILGKPLYENSIAIWLLLNPIIELLNNINIDQKYKIIRYLDIFYILVPIENSALRKELFIQFFNLLGESYDRIIDINRNKENIKNLFNIVKFYLPSFQNSTILDYGCGTGLSLEIAKNYHINIIGFDTCPIMLNLARERGMKIWNGKDILKQPLNTIDASISSYVFHLLPEDENLNMLFKLLKSGSVLVANFHKDFGLEQANKYLVHLGFKKAPLPNITLSKRHGTYGIFIKSK